jgi:hypothetical protein
MKPDPQALLPVLTEGVWLCQPHHYICPGRDGTRPLTTRSIETIVRRAADSADLPRYEVTALSLRHAFAVHALQQDWSVRPVQLALGLKNVRGVFRYLRCNVPAEVVSPADLLPKPDQALVAQADPKAFRLPFLSDPTSTPCARLAQFYALFKRALRAILAPSRPPG